MKRTKRTNTDMRLAVDFTAALALPFPLTRRESRRLLDANVQIGRALNYAQRVAERGTEWATHTYGECPEVGA